jgi:hypothetical protein
MKLAAFKVIFKIIEDRFACIFGLGPCAINILDKFTIEIKHFASYRV